MKFGVREICDVVLKAKANQKVGNKIFYKGEPVIYFDTLKTSSMEGAATTVYAQGGRGNSRLVAWEGERTVTFTMEDALISPAGFMILSGAGLIEGSDEDNGQKIIVHATEQTDHVSNTDKKVYVKNLPYLGKNKSGETLEAYGTATEDLIYVMLLDENGEIISEPLIPTAVSTTAEASGDYKGEYAITIGDSTGDLNERGHKYKGANGWETVSAVLVDYYVEKGAGTMQVDITPDKFGGNYYLEASTLFRTQQGVDMPAEFIIPNCKIQSNFTFTMASSGDPSSFTFTMDAFPDYTRFDKTKKVLAAIQIIAESSEENALRRASTPASTTQIFDEDDNAAEWAEGGEAAVKIGE